ncbi:hypothetical protein ACFFOS_24080 [Nocardioides kongjuensis]|uniref:Uncharacterized protein n=1 Tax=Nocardioides kongjuensis TaxID=349522 RepID=A0A852RS56_9ACTN|nr:hypothetical protein [Nocardioides kongjuensis]NYD33358.1 hypothetical protein [Nocardioides kongjuensis]
MDTTTANGTTPGLRAALLKIARKYEDLGAQAAAGAPYWEPCPSTVVSFRAVAEALRSEVEDL